MGHINYVRKNFQIRTLIKKLFTKYRFLKKLPQISHIHKNRNFLKYNWNFLNQPLLPYKFHGGDMTGIYFFIFASCEPLNTINLVCICLCACLEHSKEQRQKKMISYNHFIIFIV